MGAGEVIEPEGFEVLVANGTKMDGSGSASKKLILAALDQRDRLGGIRPARPYVALGRTLLYFDLGARPRGTGEPWRERLPRRAAAAEA